MKKILLLICVFVITLNAHELLVKVPCTNILTTSAMIKQGIPVILELPDAALVNLSSSQLALVMV